MSEMGNNVCMEYIATKRPVGLKAESTKTEN
jgi:hypothetical protein